MMAQCLELKDGKATCYVWAARNQCTLNPAYMEKTCKQSCCRAQAMAKLRSRMGDKAVGGNAQHPKKKAAHVDPNVDTP